MDKRKRQRYSLSTTDRQKITKGTKEVNHSINQQGLIDIYRTFYPTRAEYTLFSSVHGIYIKGRPYHEPQNKPQYF